MSTYTAEGSTDSMGWGNGSHGQDMDTHMIGTLPIMVSPGKHDHQSMPNGGPSELTHHFVLQRNIEKNEEHLLSGRGPIFSSLYLFYISFFPLFFCLLLDWVFLLLHLISSSDSLFVVLFNILKNSDVCNLYL